MSKDWTGNSIGVFKALSASNHTDKEREINDFYATEPTAIDLLVKKVKLPHNIFEPACGNGCLSERLKDFGHSVVSYDIADRGYGDVQNFFELLVPPIYGDYAIVTNPPYKYASEFVQHSLELVPADNLVCMFLKTTFAEGKSRYLNIFRFTPPMLVLQSVERILCAKNADFDFSRKHGSAVSYAWWIWKKGYRGQTVLDWVM